MDEYISALSDLAREKSLFSAATLQRHLKIGYNRAKEILDFLVAAGVAEQAKGHHYKFITDPDSFATKIKRGGKNAASVRSARTAQEVFKGAFDLDFLCSEFVEVELDVLAAELRLIRDNARDTLIDFESQSRTAIGDLEQHRADLDSMRHEYLSKVAELKTELDKSLNHYELLKISDRFFSLTERVRDDLESKKAEIDRTHSLFSSSLQQKIKHRVSEAVEADMILGCLPAAASEARNSIAGNERVLNLEKSRKLAGIICAAVTVIVAALALFFAWPLVLHTIEYIQEMGVVKSAVYTGLALAVAALCAWVIANGTDSLAPVVGVIAPLVWLLYAYVGVGLVAGAGVGGFFLWRWLTKTVEARLEHRRKALQADLAAQATSRLNSLLGNRSQNTDVRTDQQLSSINEQCTKLAHTCELHRKEASLAFKKIKRLASEAIDGVASTETRYRDFYQRFFYGSTK